MAIESENKKKFGGARSICFLATAFYASTVVVTSEALKLDGRNLRQNMPFDPKTVHEKEHGTSACTSYMRSVIEAQLPVSVPCPNREDTTCVPTCLETKCPEPTWLEKYFRDIVPQKQEDGKNNKLFLGVSVGCNTGLDAINTFRMGSNSERFSKEAWVQSMFDETTSQNEIAGACKQGDGPSFPIVRESAERPAIMHCVEPIPSTVKQLQASATELGLDGTHNSILQKFIVSPYAISEQDSSGILFPSKVPTGVENLSLAACDTSPEEQERYGCQEVPVYSLNTYGERFLSDELRDPTQNIQILNIDAEGYDFNIMKGGRDVLKRTEYLEFEVHLRKPWRHQSLKEAVDMLDDIGFSCYWAGHGSLWRLNGEGCFLDHYEDKCWSNVACANRRLAPELTEIMEEIFIETLNMNGKNDEAWLTTN